MEEQKDGSCADLIIDEVILFEKRKSLCMQKYFLPKECMLSVGYIKCNFSSFTSFFPPTSTHSLTPLAISHPLRSTPHTSSTSRLIILKKGEMTFRFATVKGLIGKHCSCNNDRAKQSQFFELILCLGGAKIINGSNCVGCFVVEFVHALLIETERKWEKRNPSRPSIFF